MTDENTPTDDIFAASAPQADQPVRRTRARRVATSGTTTPRSSTPVTLDTPPSGADAPDEPAVAAEPVTEPTAADTTTAAAAPRARSRRATSTGRAPAGGAVEAPTATELPDAPVVPDAPADSSAPAAAAERPQRSRRATSSGARAAAGEPAAAGSDGTEGTARTDATAAAALEAADQPGQAVEQPARAPRQRRSRSAAAGLEPDGAAPAVPTTPTLDVLAELGEPRTPAAVESPRLPPTALLFQAPDPTRRSRRAQAPAGPPKLEDVAPGEPLDGEELDELDEIQEEDELEAQPARPARGGRSRRRGGAAEQAAEPAPPVADAEPDEDDDEDAEPGEGDEQDGALRRRRRRGGRGRRSRSGGGERAEEDAAEGRESIDGTDEAASDEPAPSRRRSRAAVADAPVDDEDGQDDEGDDTDEGEEGEEGTSSSSRRRRRRRRGSRGDGAGDEPVAAPAAAASSRTRTRTPRAPSDEVTALKGSTRLEAKRQRRREGRDAGRRRSIVTESEFLARRESVERSMVVREANDRVQIAVLEDGVLVEHFVSRSAQNAQSSMAGNVYLGRVQNVLPSMEAAFVDVGKGRNAVLYAGEVNWDAAGLEGQPRRIEQALKSGDSVLVQVTKDPIGHKGARLTSQITLAGRYLVYVPGGGMTGISRKLPDNERARLKKLLKEIVPDAAGVIVRTAAEGASEDELRRDVQRLQDQWAAIEKKAKTASAPALLQGEPDLAIRVVRDIFNDDFSSLVVQGDGAWSMISEYVDAMAPDLAEKVSRWTGTGDVFAAHRVDEQLAKGMDRKVWLPSGGSLVIDRTEAMTVVDVNTGKFTGSGGTLEETVTRNNIEAAEEIVRQLRLRDIGGIIVIDFIDMVLESNRDLVLRRLVECLGRDRTKHQVAEVTSLGLVQMTRKRVGQGLVEAFSETCQHCNGRGFIVHSEPIEQRSNGEGENGGPEQAQDAGGDPKRSRRKKVPTGSAPVTVPVLPEAREAVKATLATIAAAAAHAHEHHHEDEQVQGHDQPVDGPADQQDAPSAWTEEVPVTSDGTLDEAPRRDDEAEAREGDEAGAGDQGGEGTVEPAGPPAAAAELVDAVTSIRAVEGVAPTDHTGAEAVEHVGDAVAADGPPAAQD